MNGFFLGIRLEGTWILFNFSVTALTTMLKMDKEKKFSIKACILYDPWLFPMDDYLLEQPTEKPILYLYSPSFENIIELYKLTDRRKKFVEVIYNFENKKTNKTFASNKIIANLGDIRHL